MQITLLIGDHNFGRPGEYVEVLDAVDEQTLDDNPDYWAHKLAQHTANGGYHRLAQVTLTVPPDALTQALYPESTPIAASADPNSAVRITDTTEADSDA